MLEAFTGLAIDAISSLLDFPTAQGRVYQTFMRDQAVNLTGFFPGIV